MHSSLAISLQAGKVQPMKVLLAALFLGSCVVPSAIATTITVMPIFEPITLVGTDGDDAMSDIGEALQASVLSRPMALSGAFPEDLVDAIRSPHLLPTNNENYKVQEVNLLVLCNLGLKAEMVDGVLQVKFKVAEFAVPEEIDLTSRQILKLTLIALRKTLEDYQRRQTQPLHVNVIVDGAEGEKAPLADLAVQFTVVGEGT